MSIESEELENARRGIESAYAETPEKYHKYITLLPQNKKVGSRQNPKWVQIEKPYIAVDGRVRMAVDDHREACQTLEMSSEFVVCPVTSYLLCVATINSGIFGVVKGTARAFIDSTAGADATNPHEVAETSAIGRALGFMGYGLLGGGIASSEEVQVAQAQVPKKPEPPTAKDKPAPPPKAAPKREASGPPPTEKQKAFLGKLQDELRNKRGFVERQPTTVAEAKDAIDEMLKLKDANEDEPPDEDRVRKKFWVDIRQAMEWSGKTEDDLRAFVNKEWGVSSTKDLTSRQRAICIEEMTKPAMPEMTEEETAAAMAEVKSILEEDGSESEDDIPPVGSWGHVKAQIREGGVIDGEEFERYVLDEYRDDYLDVEDVWGLPDAIARRYEKMINDSDQLEKLIKAVDTHAEGWLK